MYYLGTSIKDLGKKCFGINKIEDMKIIEKNINLQLKKETLLNLLELPL